MNDQMEDIKLMFPKAGKENLIPMLQELQNQQGYISEATLKQIGDYLGIPASRVFGVATFYNQFRFEPLGKYHIQVCRGTACHVLGSATVLQSIEKNLGIKAGQTSRDRLFSIEVVACIGACGLAPVICINGEFHARVTQESIREIIGNLRNGENNGISNE